jgi:hypothetical protein
LHLQEKKNILQLYGTLSSIATVAKA